VFKSKATHGECVLISKL